MLKMHFDHPSNSCLCSFAKKKTTTIKKTPQLGCVSLSALLFTSPTDLININCRSLQLQSRFIPLRFDLKASEVRCAPYSLNFQLMWVWGWAALCPDSESTIKEDRPANLEESARVGLCPNLDVFPFVCTDITFSQLILDIITGCPSTTLQEHSLCPPVEKVHTPWPQH